MVDSNMFLARVAEQAERYEDMVEFLTPLLQKRDHFSPEERNLLSVTFKNLVTPKRNTWRTIQAVEQQNMIQGMEGLEKYKQVIEERLQGDCLKVVELVSSHVVPKVEKKWKDDSSSFAIEERAFFHKMVGDYYRYACETIAGKKSDSANKLRKGALNGYKKAQEVCKGL